MQRVGAGQNKRLTLRGNSYHNEGDCMKELIKIRGKEVYLEGLVDISLPTLAIPTISIFFPNPLKLVKLLNFVRIYVCNNLRRGIHITVMYYKS